MDRNKIINMNTQPITNTAIFKYKQYFNEYYEVDDFDNLEKEKCIQSYGVCFCGDKLVIGKHGKNNLWTLLGGKIEEEESFEDALKREVQEESNMKIINFKPVGYQKVTEVGTDKYIYQLRFFCSVEPYGPFIEDPAGSIVEIKLIDPLTYKEYFDWGEIGDAIMKKSIQILENKIL